jgi:glycosyltransferase involved in cell wall biosynthesis
MKIAIIGSRGYPYVYSGYETFVQGLGERLVRRGIGITVYCHKNLFKQRPPQVNGINLIYLPTIERKILAQFLHSLQAIIHACLRNYDVILMLNAANGPLGILPRILRKKTVINVDGLEWQRPRWKGLGGKYFYWAAKLASKLYEVVITDSFQMQQIYAKEFQAKTMLIAYGADLRYTKDAGLIKKWELKKGEYYLIVARLIPDNNIALLLEEFRKTSSRKKLVIVGEAPQPDRYARKIKANRDSRLIFTGYVLDQDILAELYLNCFAYLHGHEFGGTNPSLLEALACGCAVIALDTVFNREVLRDGDYGIFFQKNKDNLKELIEKAEGYPDLLSVYRSQARERIEENYNWERITQQYLDLFQKLEKGAYAN